MMVPGVAVVHAVRPSVLVSFTGVLEGSHGTPS